MPKFFREGFSDNDPAIYGADADHISKSLRMQKGEGLTVGDLCGRVFECRIAAVEPGRVSLEILSSAPDVSEPDVSVTLFQCMPKGDKLETVIQKAVELGVAKIVPVLSSRCVSRPDNKSFEKKLVRLNRIAAEAAVQSGRGSIPEVAPPLSLKEAAAQLSGFDSALFFYEGGGAPIGELIKGKRIAVVIGPEGGFSTDEVKLATDNGAFAASLGPRILRTETAPLAALSAIMYLTGNLQ